jgi:hypothetical protein
MRDGGHDAIYTGAWASARLHKHVETGRSLIRGVSIVDSGALIVDTCRIPPVKFYVYQRAEPCVIPRDTPVPKSRKVSEDPRRKSVADLKASNRVTGVQPM